MSSLDAQDAEILALFLGEYRDEKGSVPNKVRDYNRGVLRALNCGVPSGILDNHQIRKLHSPKVVFRCFMEQCAIDGTIDSQEWTDQIYEDLKDFELSDNSKAEIRQAVKYEAEIAGEDFFLVKYTKDLSEVQEHDFEIDFDDNSIICKEDKGRTKDKYTYGHNENKDDSNAEYNLGICYQQGSGVERNIAQAIECYRKAAAKGHADAQNRLGVRFYYGDGVERNYAQAARYFRLAAIQNHAVAQSNLAFMYFLGEGVSKDLKEAFHWFEMSSTQGYPLALYMMGLFYDNITLVGDVTNKDIDIKYEYYKMAAEAGNKEAQYVLGNIYWYGGYLKQDLEKGRELLEMSAEQGHPYAQEMMFGPVANGNKDIIDKWRKRYEHNPMRRGVGNEYGCTALISGFRYVFE